MKKKYLEVLLLFAILIIIYIPYIANNKMITFYDSDFYLSVLTIALTIIGIINKNKQSLKLEFTNNLSNKYEPIKDLLQIELAPKTGNSMIKFETIIHGITKKGDFSNTELENAIKRLYSFVSMYISYIEIYKNEYGNDFFYENHKNKATMLLTSIEFNLEEKDKEKLEPPLTKCWIALDTRNDDR
ncbi:MAG: hypothetical protein PF487_08425 [Bacteroidales bacterium]|nr:hypothetical protein [Bacteroidales bacterium]